MRKKMLSFGAALLCRAAPVSQIEAAPREAQSHYDKGIALYEKQKYSAAQTEFEKAARGAGADDVGFSERAAYYIALCAAEMRQGNAREMLDRFILEYPGSIYANDIRFSLGTLLHEEGDYQAAYAQYQQVDPYELDFSRFDEYNFRTGYAAYMCGDTDKAYGYFKNCNTDPQYKPHATYYIAYIDYSRGDLQAAKREFASIADNPAYEPIIPFYLLQIEFRENNYDYVVANGIPLLAKATEARQQEISRIVSEAYFHLGDYPKALAYMDFYAYLGGEMWSEDLYLGC